MGFKNNSKRLPITFRFGRTNHLAFNGASLQQYNPLIDDEVKKAWNIPWDWNLIAQMPFGKPTADPGDKEFSPLEERVKYYR